jgi:hypothetical protein
VDAYAKAPGFRAEVFNLFDRGNIVRRKAVYGDDPVGKAPELSGPRPAASTLLTPEESFN